MSKYLVLKGCAGIGNRIISACKALAYAQQTGRKLYIDWSDGQFGYRGDNVFYKYFEFADTRVINNFSFGDFTESSVYPDKKWLFEDGVYDQTELYTTQVPTIIKRLFRSGKYSRYTECWRLLSAGNDAEYLIPFSTDYLELGEHLSTQLDEDVVIFISFIPPFETEIFAERFRIRKEIEAQIDLHKAKIMGANSSYLAVHVRASDKMPTKDIETLFQAVDQKKDKYDVLFLATDNVKIEQSFQERYTNVVVQPKELPELKGEGLHQWALYNEKHDEKEKMFFQSIIDIALLAKSDYLIYQGNSSFSIIANELRKKENSINWLA